MSARARKGASGRKRERVVKLTAITFGLTLVLFLGGYLFATRVLFPPLPEPKDGIVVPKLTGLTVAQAEARLVSLGLRVTATTELAHPTTPPGIIVAQSPLPGQQLRTAGAVQLGVSSGPPPAPPPPPPPRDTATLPDSTLVPDTLSPDTTVAPDTLTVSASRGTT